LTAASGGRARAMVQRWWRRFAIGLEGVMAILLFVMMMLTAADVIGRYLLDAPIPGGFEIVQYLMALVIFAGLPLTTAADSHLSVSLLSAALRGAVGRAHQIYVRLFSTVALVFIAWRMADEALILDQSEQVSGYLQFPLWPIAAVMAALASLAVLVIVVKLVLAVLGRDAPGRAPRGID
jgi:TRAP-type C4-dicarboxylate transport system permease small subunit